MVSRRIWDHPDLAKSEFSEREAFLWLVSEASWRPRRVRSGKAVVDLERGQLCASVRFMASAWMWSKSRVDRFLKRVQAVEMIRAESGTGQLIITVCNYDKFQGQRDTGGTVAGQQRDSSGTNENKGNKGNKDNIAQIGFDDFWAIVPRKVGKGQARKAYAASLKKTDAATIFQAMKAYAETRIGQDETYTAHPATWLNGERWTDAPPKLTPIIGGQNGKPTSKSEDRMHAFIAGARGTP